LAWAVYSVSSVWMTDTLHLELGDSLARMGDARAMLFSRDPHLAALGLYWMPLPTVGQLPFMLFLSPLHHAELSGPLACAFAGAVTVLVIARICFIMGLSKGLSVAITLVYAFNPIVVYSNGNGMSEAWILMTTAFAMLGFLRWSTQHRTIDLAVLGAGLAGVALARYEGFVLAPIIAVVAALNDGRTPPRADSLRTLLEECRSRYRRWLTTAAIVAIPTYVVLALWILMNYVIARDPLKWYKLQKAVGHTQAGSYQLPAHQAIPILASVLQSTVIIVPAFLVIAPLLLVIGRRYHERLTALGILAGALLWPAIVAMGFALSESSGVPRYFEPPTVFVTVAAIWLAGTIRPSSERLRRAVPFVLVGILVAGAIVGAANLENPTRTGVESENQFFSRLFNHHVTPLKGGGLGQNENWKALAAGLDTRLTPGRKVLVDVSASGSAVFIFTHTPGRFIVNSDRDYERIVADPVGKFDYIVVSNPTFADTHSIGTQYSQFLTIISNTVGGHWVKWRDYNVASIYQWVADRAGPG
jgi:hypothetical protein